jgi:hypothetical protein
MSDGDTLKAHEAINTCVMTHGVQIVRQATQHIARNLFCVQYLHDPAQKTPTRRKVKATPYRGSLCHEPAQPWSLLHPLEESVPLSLVQGFGVIEAQRAHN